MKSPDILIPGKLKEINNYLLERTGCFAFLISDYEWHYSEPMTGKGAVELWSVALYTIYHDYGCRYLKFILDKNNCPDESIHYLLNRSYKHMRNIQSVLRPIIVHGVFDSCSSMKLKNIFLPKDSKTIEQITDDQWYRVAEKIIKDSNELVETIYKWAEIYINSNFNIKNRFGKSEDFIKSIDSRIVYNSLDNDFCSNSEKRAISILEENDRKLPEKKLELWREEISSLFLADQIKTPEDIITKLKSYLFEVHYPTVSSSTSIGEKYGFALSSLI